MKRFGVSLLILVSLVSSLASAQSINFTADTNTRVQNRWRIAFPAGLPVIVPPLGGGSTTPLSVSAGVSSVNGNSGAVTVSWLNLPNKPTSVATSGLSDAATTTQVNSREPAISAGTSGQYFDGTKTFKALNQAAVGLPNLTNSLQVINAGGAVSYAAGTLANRPAAATAGRYYTATDQSATYYDNGTSWVLQQAALTGDVTLPAGGTVATLPTVNANVGSFGSATTIPVPTVNAKGQVTGMSSAAVSPTGIGSAAVKTITLTNTTNGTIITHNLASLYNITNPVMTAVVYQNGQPDGNIVVQRNDDNSIKILTPLKVDGSNETVTGFVRVWVTP